MKFAVIGAGLMGRAAVYDLTRAENVDQVGVCDIDGDLAREIAERFGDGKAVSYQLDAGNESEVERFLRNYDAAVSCVGYELNLGLTCAAISAGCHLVDLGGNNDVVRAQCELSSEAEEAGIVVIPDCGLAPGMVSVMVADGVAKLDEVDTVKIRVGGLPQVPRHPLKYQMVFSAEGLLNEYWEPCFILNDGKKETVNPMTGVELLEFDGIGKVEAFYTSGGASTLPETYEGKVRFLDYKTIRYPGHCQLFKPMLEIGLGSRREIEVDEKVIQPRSMLKAILDRNLSFGDPDLVLVRVQIEGVREQVDRVLVYEIIDRQDDRSGLTAMMRTTSFPATIVAWMAASGQITERGIKPQEVVVKPSLFFPQLKKRGINLVIRD